MFKCIYPALHLIYLLCIRSKNQSICKLFSHYIDCSEKFASYTITICIWWRINSISSIYTYIFIYTSINIMKLFMKVLTSVQILLLCIIYANACDSKSGANCCCAFSSCEASICEDCYSYDDCGCNYSCTGHEEECCTGGTTCQSDGTNRKVPNMHYRFVHRLDLSGLINIHASLYICLLFLWFC